MSAAAAVRQRTGANVSAARGNSGQDESNISHSNGNHVNNPSTTKSSFFADMMKALSAAYDIRAHLRLLFSPRASSSAASAAKSSSSSSSSSSVYCLDGYRAFLCLWMICFHSMFYLMDFSFAEPFKRLGGHPLLTFIMFGFLPVDGFYVLTGFLLAQPIFQEEKKIAATAEEQDKHHNKKENGISDTKTPQKWFSVENFQYRRIVRFLPTYLLSFVLYCTVVFPGSVMHPISFVRHERVIELFRDLMGPDVQFKPNSCDPLRLTGAFVFINNILPFGGCMGWTWSMAVQFAFYLFFPILIYFCLRQRKSSSAATAVYVLNHFRFLFFVAGLLLLTMLLRFYAFLHIRRFDDHLLGIKVWLHFSLYSSAFMRISTIFLGAFIAYVSVYYGQKITRWINESSIIVRESACAAVWGVVVCIALSQVFYNYIYNEPVGISAPGAVAVSLSQAAVPYKTIWDGINLETVNLHLPHWLYWAIFIVGSPLCGVLFALVVFMIIHRIGFIGTLLSDFFSLRFWSPLSTLSFQAYLYHPIVMSKTYISLMHAWGELPLSIEWFAAYCIWNIVVTFAISFVIWLLVEQPADLLTRNSKTVSVDNNAFMRILNSILTKFIRIFAILVTIIVTVLNCLHILIILFAIDPATIDPKALRGGAQPQSQ